MEQAHAHPITVIRNLWRVLYLIIIPIIRGFVAAIQGGFSGWLQGAWMDIVILLFMVFVAVWRWYWVTYYFDDRALHIKTGIILRKTTHIPWSKIISVSTRHSFFLKPFRAVHFRADTLGGSFNNADFSIYLGRRQTEEIVAAARDVGKPAKEYDYSPKTLSIVALSLLTSNSFAGIVFVATFVSQTGRLLGNEVSDLLIDTVENAARNLAFGIPPAAAFIAYVLLIGWFFAFLLTFFRYKNMQVTKTDNTLSITGGLFSLREYYIRYQDVYFLDIRQSLPTKVLKLYSLYISAIGYGKQKDDISCVIPTENQPTFSRVRKRLFPAFTVTDRQIKPTKTGFMRFLADPLYPCLGIPLAMFILIWIFPNWKSFILFVGLMLMVPSILFFAIRFMDFMTCGIAFDGNYYTLRYSKGFYLHTVVIPKDAVAAIQLRQGLFQRFGKNCDLLLYAKAEGRSLHLCRNLPMEELQRLLVG